MLQESCLSDVWSHLFWVGDPSNYQAPCPTSVQRPILRAQHPSLDHQYVRPQSREVYKQNWSGNPDLLTGQMLTIATPTHEPQIRINMAICNGGHTRLCIVDNHVIELLFGSSKFIFNAFLIHKNISLNLWMNERSYKQCPTTFFYLNKGDKN